MPKAMPGARAIRVSEKVWWVGNGGWGGTPKLSKPGDCNVYLLDGGDELALVDAGGATSNRQILANVRGAGFEARKIRWIFLTHAHQDHSQGAAWFRKQTGGRIAAGRVTARALQQPERLLIGGMQPFSKFAFEPVRVDRVLEDGDVVSVGDIRVKVVYTPGHTLDAVCFVARARGEKVLFSGDTLVGNQPRADFGRVFRGMLGWLDGHWSTSITRYIKTLKRLRLVRPDVTLPGHGIPNDGLTTRDAIASGIGNLKRIIDNPETMIMFAVSR